MRPTRLSRFRALRDASECPSILDRSTTGMLLTVPGRTACRQERIVSRGVRGPPWIDRFPVEYRYRAQRFFSGIIAEERTIPVPPSQSELAAGVNYFFALLPGDEARVAIFATGQRLRKSHRVIGSVVGAESLLLPLCPKGKSERLHQPLEATLLEAGSAVSAAGFDVALDTAMRFSAKDGQFPFVLCADSHTTESAIHLRKAIAAEQARAGLQVSGVSSYLPHVVLLHGNMIEPIEDAISPIHWKAREFVLIRSFFGQSRHQVIGRWPLLREPEPVAHNMLDELANMPDLPDLDDELI